jgi:hypothetical protein
MKEPSWVLRTVQKHGLTFDVTNGVDDYFIPIVQVFELRARVPETRKSKKSHIFKES